MPSSVSAQAHPAAARFALLQLFFNSFCHLGRRQTHLCAHLTLVSHSSQLMQRSAVKPPVPLRPPSWSPLASLLSGLRYRAPCRISLTPWHARTPTVSIAVCVPVWVTTRIPPGGFKHWCHCPLLLRLSLAETCIFGGGIVFRQQGKTVRSERWRRTSFLT